MDLTTFLHQKGYGAMSDLGRLVGVPSQTIRDWSIGRRRVPDDWCPAIEISTGGDVTCEELRGDLSWVRMPDAGWPGNAGRPLIDHAIKLIKSSAIQPGTEATEDKKEAA